MSLNITPEQLGFKPVGDNTDGGTLESCLHGQIRLAGLTCHVQAYEVTVGADGVVSAVNPAYDDEVEALYTLSADSLSTVEIDGRIYVVTAFPHAA